MPFSCIGARRLFEEQGSRLLSGTSIRCIVDETGTGAKEGPSKSMSLACPLHRRSEHTYFGLTLQENVPASDLEDVKESDYGASREAVPEADCCAPFWQWMSAER